MRRLLLKLLLLAVFFNTAIGVPLHEAKHLGQAHPEITQESLLPFTDEQFASGEGRVEVHALCTWCAAYAQQATALPAAVVTARSVEPVARVESPPALAVAPGQTHWPFAARGPPATT